MVITGGGLTSQDTKNPSNIISEVFLFKSFKLTLTVLKTENRFQSISRLPTTKLTNKYSIYTPWTNIAAISASENMPSQSEFHLPTIDFQGLLLLVPGRYTIPIVFDAKLRSRLLGHRHAQGRHPSSAYHTPSRLVFHERHPYPFWTQSPTRPQCFLTTTGSRFLRWTSVWMGWESTNFKWMPTRLYSTNLRFVARNGAVIGNCNKKMHQHAKRCIVQILEHVRTSIWEWKVTCNKHIIQRFTCRLKCALRRAACPGESYGWCMDSVLKTYPNQHSLELTQHQ